MHKYSYNPEIDEDKKPLFDVLLDLVEVFKQFCEKHDLTYFAVGGTLLGAVRHNGFIPWDDDVDLGMMRNDFNRLLELIENEELPYPYRFLTPLTDPSYGKGLIRLTNVNTTAISINTVPYNYNKGIFIDIFPVDSVPDNKWKAFLFKSKLILCSNLRVICSRYNSNLGTIGLSRLTCAGYRLLLPLLKHKLITMEKMFRITNRVASRYEGKDTKRVGQVTFSTRSRLIFDRSIFSTIESHRFESIEINIPAGYDAFLSHQYGNYMVEVKEASFHGNTCYDVNTPYPEYFNQHKKQLYTEWKEYIRRKKRKK